MPWEHPVKASSVDPDFATAWSCAYCSSPLVTVVSESLPPKPTEDRWSMTDGFMEKRRMCRQCGWWNIERTVDFTRCGGPDHEVWERDIYGYGVVGALRTLDLGEIATPLDEVRKFLVARYERRFSLDPKLFEETVGSVFADLGYDVVVTGKSGDGGIDAVLRRDEEEVGVQVKKYKDVIEVDQIREFTGALFIEGFTRGIFVTTSGFRSTAPTIARRALEKGIAVELVDSARFFDALRLAQRQSFDEDWAREFLSSFTTEGEDPLWINEVSSVL